MMQVFPQTGLLLKKGHQYKTRAWALRGEAGLLQALAQDYSEYTGTQKVLLLRWDLC